jgi:GT2 family glycosyltransferase
MIRAQTGDDVSDAADLHPAAPRVSVIIVSWNTRDLTLRCLDSLEAAFGDEPVEIVVVDNASADGSASAIAERHPDVGLLRNTDNVGFARGVNAGLREVAGDYVVLLNSDAELLPGAVQHLIRHLDQHPEVGMAGGRQVDEQGRFVPAAHRFPCLWHDLATAPGIHQLGSLLLRRPNSRLARRVFITEERDVDWVSGAFVACRRSAVDAVGPLPEEFFVYGEDVEWCWRFHELGWRITYAGGPGIVHHGGRSADQLAGDDRWLRVLDALYVFARQHRRGASWRAGWVARSAFLWLRVLRRTAGGRRAPDPEVAVLAQAARRCWSQATGRFQPETGDSG